jgi:hypothetical protein
MHGHMPSLESISRKSVFLIDHTALPLIERGRRVILPKFRLLQNSDKYFFGDVERPAQTGQEPFQPRRDIEATFLCPFENGVIGVSLQSGLRGHAVKALLARSMERSPDEK